jgi:hypothetical protein
MVTVLYEGDIIVSLFEFRIDPVRNDRDSGSGT